MRKVREGKKKEGKRGGIGVYIYVKCRCMCEMVCVRVKRVAGWSE
jgi:hypothetical protein